MIKRFVVVETVYPEIGSEYPYAPLRRLYDDSHQTLSSAKKAADLYNRSNSNGGQRIYHAEVR